MEDKKSIMDVIAELITERADELVTEDAPAAVKVSAAGIAFANVERKFQSLMTGNKLTDEQMLAVTEAYRTATKEFKAILNEPENTGIRVVE